MAGLVEKAQDSLGCGVLWCTGLGHVRLGRAELRCAGCRATGLVWVMAGTSGWWCLRGSGHGASQIAQPGDMAAKFTMMRVGHHALQRCCGHNRAPPMVVMARVLLASKKPA